MNISVHANCARTDLQFAQIYLRTFITGRAPCTCIYLLNDDFVLVLFTNEAILSNVRLLYTQTH